ncbi:histone-lysine N-methyltransferase, H3 lysine-9 specific SUVH1-like [Phalaenopsis equestris]|uniref:histone-lysine N-methyltransferase, H3 lysine-9 specific SUVH1-like n=1 Tax=Phalaenopsis equestris TaxID=78828 RepID=UPI0009E3DC38|nr:histone-lysine N-methyltransferase, H3 lysine-9 specific SUVH1-like [Phalaenopsis equestris]
MEARKTQEDAVLDVKPLRSLAPMFPAPYGFNTTFSFSGSSPPFVCVSPFGDSSSSENSFHAFFTAPAPSSPPAKAQPLAANGPYPQSRVPINLHENSEQAIHTSSYGRKVKPSGKMSRSFYNGWGDSETEGGSERSKSRRRKRPRKITDLSLICPSSLDPRESVEVVLMTFDALRRRLLQLDETTDASKRADLKAGAIMTANDLRANVGKRIGSVPGVDVGDIFFFRIELCLVGMHAPSMGGIDYMITKYSGADEPAAISIVSSGGYENDEGDANVLIYTGQGGGVGNRHAEKIQLDDQKLERGNLALEKSMHRGNSVRVIRSAKDMNLISGKIYIYDGLYKIHESWIDKGKSGFNIFKYKLLREPGQPEGLGVWKRTTEWRSNPSSRGKVILPDISSGIENLPVCLVNEVDDAKGPNHFTYSTSLKYMRPVSSMRPLESCPCLSVCLPGDANCSCSQQNDGILPYSSSGLLVSRKSMVYECNNLCSCTINCRNRVTQKGLKLHFEVFRTRDRGWGLRSWDAIRAGTFICEFAGEVVQKIEVDDYGEETHYNFRATYLDEKTKKWNHTPELIGEPSINQNEIFKPLPIIIDAKNVGNIARFMNHSCSPNVFWQPVLYDHGEEGYPHIMFFAIKHIPPMTELTFDYGVSGDDKLSSLAGIKGPKECLCGSPKCRGVFG